MNPSVLLGSVVAGGASGYAVWRLVVRPQRVHFGPRTTWWDRWSAGVVRRWQKGWSDSTRLALDTLRQSERDVQRNSLMFAGVGFALVLILGTALRLPLSLAGVLALVAGVGIAYGVLPWWIRRQAADYRRGVMVNYPLVLVMLRFYLSLDYPLIRVFNILRPLLGPRGRREVERILGDISSGTPGAQALEASRVRIDKMEWTTLMDTLAQNWGHQYSSENLKPLNLLLEGQREQAALRLTGRLDVVTTLVPIIAIFGTLLGGLFVLGAGMLSGAGVLL